MRDGNSQHLALPACRREGKIGSFDQEVCPLAAELERRVADEGAGEQPRLAEDLEPVADAPDEAAAVGKLADLLHHRREPGDGTRSQVVAVRKTAGQDHAVATFQISIFVPEVGQFRSDNLVDDPAAVPVGPRAGKNYDSRSEEHTSELQSQFHLVCRLLLEKKKTKK